MTAIAAKTNLSLGTHLVGTLDDEIARLRLRIEEQAILLATERDLAAGKDVSVKINKAAVVVSVGDLSAAIDDAIGKQVPQTSASFFFTLFPPFTCLSVLLCAVFGILGYLAATGYGGDVVKNSANGFLDVAKLFAGAVVGSTASTAIKTKSQKSIL